MTGEQRSAHHPALDAAPLLAIGALVVAAAGIRAAGGLVAILVFSALAAILCRRLELVLRGRGLGPRAAVALTVAVFCLLLATLVVAFAASAIALAYRLADERDRIGILLQELAATFAAVTGLPAAEVPAIDSGMLVDAAQDMIRLAVPGAAGLAISVLVVTYLLLDADRLGERLRGALGAERIARYDELAASLVVYVRMRAILGAGAAVADTVLLLVVGVPYAWLWGIVSLLFSFVPNIGFILSLIPPAALAFVAVGPLGAIVVVAGYVAINVAFDYVVQPRVMAHHLDLSPAVVVISLLGWAWLIGPPGTLLAVPLTMTLRTLLAPVPAAAWFVALLGPVPDDRAPVAAPAFPGGLRGGGPGGEADGGAGERRPGP